MIKITKTYYVDLGVKTPKVAEISANDLKNELSKHNLVSAKDFETHDLKVFSTEKKAVKFLESYNDALKKIKNSDLCTSKNGKSLLIKRRWMATALMGVKKSTMRHYKKDWKKGDLFNLYDQTYTLTVKLKSIKKVNNEMYEYKYDLLK